ncbi:acyl-coenzyme A--6-aminopenicillanic acid acyl-transferase [Streptomyces sp. 8K308]|uniref:C45 family autoproteolytic acyltransferase/hydolase n=1 Tax=Streptomyces sp. 8K308 TaxID=2530388 RepID=UPI00104B9225|nr:C45 family peptidase [Streptomyces sp. 8K308]TDC24798.1 acyl-coenzyme A--6-aminopenicillanic acid acyl-transferase [Streptomyces sp. 8K308]
MALKKTFRATAVGDGGDGRWAAEARAAWPEAEKWLTDEGRTAAGAAEARRLFDTHLPELVPVLERLAAQLDRGRLGETFLTQAAFRPFFAACTQAAFDGVLLRNYDFPPDEVEGTFVSSNFLRPVIGSQDGIWGLLDGMNDAGLAVSLTFGGRLVHGPGLAVLIVVRYLLETCDTVDEALAALRRIPVALSQNLTLVDRERAVTVYLGPDMEPTEAAGAAAGGALACAANHQHLPVSEEEERGTNTEERLATVRAVAEGREPEQVRRALLRPPLYRYGHEGAGGTVYTAEYRPAEGRVTYLWPGEEPWELSFDAFEEGGRTVTLGREA